ncbi:14830_t:CDS:1 [Funneliformis geosporum]|uniref:10328_t:CDS:1 n=1 Tax=Funneliformis geosporum TaxID=1117311 RepID=A0A9W4SR17_9GLOM|nr:14830_t:CDS:1 [Funneliformis geosporum]CAI2178472.1 10328_t:CDS:1 [Funneliformis geosporum]
MYQPKTSQIIFVLAFLIGLVSQVSAHGILLTPPIRLAHDDDNANKILQAVNPTTQMPCGAGGDGYGPVTKFKPGDSMYIAYNVSIPHPGPCKIEFSKKNDKHFKTIMELGECGSAVGLVSAFVDLPHEPCDECTVRFSWNDDLGNWYLNCANVQIEDPMPMHKRSVRRLSTRKSRRNL